MTTESPKEIAEIMQQNQTVCPTPEKIPVVSNHTGYGHEGSENFEHDESGASMNYSGVEDDLNDAESEHEGWQKDYDY
jgi:hypothetical protein